MVVCGIKAALDLLVVEKSVSFLKEQKPYS